MWALVTVLVGAASVMPVQAQTQSSTDMAWTVIDVTAQANCMARWTVDYPDGPTVVLHQEACVPGTVVEWQKKTTAEAIAAGQQYVSVNASRDEMIQFRQRVAPMQSDYFFRPKPYSSCAGTYHSQVDQRVFNTISGYATVHVDQAYTYNASCLTKYAQDDTVSYVSGPSGAWKWGSAAIYLNNGGPPPLANDADSGCNGLPRASTFSGASFNASTSVQTVWFIHNNHLCSGSPPSPNQAFSPAWQPPIAGDSE